MWEVSNRKIKAKTWLLLSLETMSSSMASFVRGGWDSSKKILMTLCKYDTFPCHSSLSCNWRSHAWAKESAEWVRIGTVSLVFSGSAFFQISWELELRQACVQLAPLSLRALINFKHCPSWVRLVRPLLMDLTSKVEASSGCNAWGWKSEAMHARALSNMAVSKNVQSSRMRSDGTESFRESFPIQCRLLSSWASQTKFLQSALKQNTLLDVSWFSYK